MIIRADSFILYTLFFGCFLFSVAMAQEQKIIEKPLSPQPYTLVLKTNPLPVIWGPVWFTSEYRFVNEFVVAPNQSSQIGISFLGKSPIFSWFDNTFNQSNRLKVLVRGFRFQLSHKFYLNELLNTGLYAPQNFYIGPLFSYSTARYTNKYLNLYDIYVRSTHINLNFIAGYQWISSKSYAIDMFAGMGYKKNTWIEHSPPTFTPMNTDDFGPFYNSNLKLIFGFNVGKAF